MKTYDLIVIGFGKAGKTIAAKAGKQGKSVAMIEKDDQMYGGTCINIGCIPTKVLIHSVETGHGFEEAMTERNAVTSRLRQKNFAMLDNQETIDVYHASAKFTANKEITITSLDGSQEELTAETIIINTGAVSNMLPIPGLSEAKNVVDSTEIQSLSSQPKKLGIIGGGNIGLEFASLYAQMGTEVTVFDPQERLISSEEEDVSDLVRKYMEEEGVSFQLSSQISSVSNDDELVVIETDKGKFTFDLVLYATGRKPNTANLGLENTDIQVTNRVAVQVDDYLQTSVPGVFAVGDVNGGLQFTYVSLDDSRIVWNYLNGNQDYSAQNRHHIPNTRFLNPPLARVGIDAKEAKVRGLHFKANALPVAVMPRAHVNGDLRGIYKVVVDTDTDLILGATLLGVEAPELINLITTAMDNHIPYTYFQRQIFTHPTMAENFNDLFNF